MIARGIPLAIGTDSLASSPDLDPLAEAVALRRAFPDVALSTWICALTEGGADALALPLGRLQTGLAPGVLHVELPATDAPLDLLLDGTNWRRRWLACPNV
jgi:cytosine/adenosine deaminase-related metal-dependent hydrolase